MSRASSIFTLFALIFVPAFLAAETKHQAEERQQAQETHHATQSHPNVLLIAVDDLRPELGCYGAQHVLSPNIDGLAASGRLFERAYCQQAVCNPSRTSLMTGMRPDSIGVTGNHSHFRTNYPDVVTLPQHFKQHGYRALAIGKIYHGVFPEGSSITKWDTMGDPASWSEPALRFGPRYYYTEAGIASAKEIYQRIYKPINPGPNDWMEKLVFGPATESPEVPDNTLYDGKVADAAVSKLRELKKADRPFFLAVGFIKPHSPFIAPKKYFDLYPDVELPPHAQLPVGAPALAGHRSGELRRYTDQPNSGSISEQNQRRIRQAYFACVSFIDAQIGRVLDELDRTGLSKNTIVVLFGDHGYHLGEHGLWGKTTNFELDTRVPLIVRAPGMKAPGKSTRSLVELVDLYPTLAHLAGLPITDQLEGRNFAVTLDDPTHQSRKAAFSQFPREGLMGYSIRTQTHRLTHWVERQSGKIRETELYDYSADLVEQKNISDASPDLIEELTPMLASNFNIADLRSQEQEAPGNRTLESKSTGFESAKPGTFETLTTPIGVWIPTAGNAVVDDKHAKAGQQCLWLAGGKCTSVTLDLGEHIDTSGRLTFWAERWTRREPFTFRIEKNTGRDWIEIFNGDNQVRVGRAFLSQVRVPLGDRDIKQLRFTVTSPPETGILIDEVQFAPAQPQRIVSVAAVPVTLPALIGAAASPLLKLKIVTAGHLDPITLTELETSLLCNRSDIESAQVYFNSSSSSFATEQLFGKSIDVTQLGAEGLESLKFSGAQTLVEGENYIWVSCKLSTDAKIDNPVGAKCLRVAFSNGKSVELNATSSQRMGVAVRQAGDDAVHTFRIPGLATTTQGTLIGVYDVRRRGGGDLPGDIDVGMSRSTDGGQTWESMKVIMDMGSDPKWQYDGVGDPAVLVDQNTNTIWVAATWSHGNRSWRGSGPGLTPEETGQLMLVRSDDDGLTWSDPINITQQVKKPQWSFILQGPGKGITMRDGTIVFAAQYQDPPNPSDKQAHRLPHSTIIYSQDHGKTWAVGSGAFADTTEAQVVEVETGVLMLNCRYNRKSSRVVMTTDDMGKTWQKHTTSERALIEPGACMASLINVDRELNMDAGGWLLFSNPDSQRGRHRITIKASPDGGLTWPKEQRLLLDEEPGAGYSCMSMIDEKTVGILYEGSQAHMTFQRIPLADVTTPQEKSTRNPKSDGAATNYRLTLPRVFGNHMVLQADSEIPVWGRAKADAEVLVTLGQNTQTAVADERGNWSVRLPARKANPNPTTMTISSSGEQVQFTDILCGEVWVCAGQSNMEWSVSQSANSNAALATADQPQVRLLHLASGARSSGGYTSADLARLTPENFCTGEWKVASAASVQSFSAVGWYFGQYLQQELDVPIGLICPAVGGTPTEAWLPRDALQQDPDLKGLVAGNWLDNKRLGEFCRTRGLQNLLPAIQAGEKIPGDEFGPNHSFKPGFMWDAAIEPLIPYAIRGTIWYQGESNAETSARVSEHSRLFPLLINQWRTRWGRGNFPFLFVQLPALKRPKWPEFRDAQRRVLGQLEQVGMAVILDTGHPSDVHPKLKKPVGERLAKWALGTTYGRSITHSGPLLDAVEREGNSLILGFTQVGDGLKSSDKKPLRHFEVCGSDGIFYPSTAKIISHNSIVVSSPNVAAPAEARYAWLPYPDPPVNLFNTADLPASPFSTETTD